MYDWTHVVSVIIFYSLLAVIFVAGFVLSDDLILRRVILFLILAEAALGVIVEQYWTALVLVFLFLFQFIKYVQLADKDVINKPTARHRTNVPATPYMPSWARHSLDPVGTLDKLDKAIRLRTPRPGEGRHRRSLLISA